MGPQIGALPRAKMEGMEERALPSAQRGHQNNGRRGGDWYTAQGGSKRWPRGVQGIAPAGSEWTKSTDMATTMWATLRADGFKPPFSSGKDVMVLTATAFELDKKTTEAVANLAELDIMNIAFKNTDF